MAASTHLAVDLDLKGVAVVVGLELGTHVTAWTQKISSTRN